MASQRSLFGPSPTSLAAVLEGWLTAPATRPNVVVRERLPPRPASYAPLPASLDPALTSALRRRGVGHLYSHQAEAYAHAREGRHTVIATPTASGKSLCYNLPVLDRLAREPGARALYLFPTKALARDQESALRELMSAAGMSASAAVYDGDTPGDVRRAVRARGGVILSNPDMLHASILPQHAAWSTVFQSLRYIVIDELHTYRGVFGSHFANLVRRLRRVARFHGSDPVFLCASATIGNPREHAARLLGEPSVELVERSGAPSGERQIVLYNPPVIDAALGLRQSCLKTSVRLTADLLRAGVSTILFGSSRSGVETMLRYLREAVSGSNISPEQVQAYRGGYLADTRRRIESELREGKVLAVVATNALELGIDIGALDAVVCAGYPGSLSATWQRFGRAGRRGEGSLAVLVASSSPIDQFLAREPNYLLSRPVEEARIDPDNVEVLLQHLKCAAFELPFERGEAFGDLDADSTNDGLELLARNGVLHKTDKRWHWIAEQQPAQQSGLRNIGKDSFVVIEREATTALAELDLRGAHGALFEQAIYQHEGVTYQVEKLDYEGRQAFVARVEPDYFTEAVRSVRVSVLHEEQHGGVGAMEEPASALGEVSVVEQVTGFKKVKFFTHENLGYGDVRLPELTLCTTAFWFTVAEEQVQELAGVLDNEARPAGRSLVLEGLRGVAHALEAVASLALLCDPRDLGYALGDKSDGTMPGKRGTPGFDPTVFLYDNHAGGVGLAARAFERRDELLGRTRVLIASCGCADGCPACVSPGDGRGDAHGRKAMALALLEALGVRPVHAEDEL